MRILSITAGAAGMYCGSCFRDNALAVELMARGHDVTLLPIYTPTRTDEVNVSRERVLFGGISVYLQHRYPLFRKMPAALDRVWDAPAVIRTLTRGATSTDPRLLGGLTLAMLDGAEGTLHREFQKLEAWLRDEPVPDVVNLPNCLLIGLARSLREVLDRPVCCTLQGEELFIQGLAEPYRSRAIARIGAHLDQIDRFIAVSEAEVGIMTGLLGIETSRIEVVPLGINLEGYQARPASASASGSNDEPFTIGYFARIAPEKGLHVLADAYARFRQRTGATARLVAAGYMSPTHAPYLEEVERTLGGLGLGDEFAYHGELDRAGKLSYLQTLDVLSVPATYDEPKGMFLLEAMASGVPVVQPRRGGFVEIVERTGGGILVEPDDPQSLADAFQRIWSDRPTRVELGRRAFDGVRAHYGIERSADRLLAVYESLIQGAGGREQAGGALVPDAGRPARVS